MTETPYLSTPYLSLVIPAYNEAHRLPGSLRELIRFTRSLNFGHEVIVVVEKSSDQTLELALREIRGQENFRIIDNQVQRGKGYATRCGMLAATGQFRFFMDADLSTPLEEIHAFLEYFNAHPEVGVLVGNRQHPETRIMKSQSWLREKMGQTFNAILRSMIPLDLADTQCGFKAFRANAARDIFHRATIDGFAFDVEILLLARRLGYKVADLPVRWVNSPESKVHILRDSFGMLLDAIRIRWKLK